MNIMKNTTRLCVILGSIGFIGGGVFAGEPSHSKAPIDKNPAPDPLWGKSGETILEAIAIYALLLPMLEPLVLSFSPASTVACSEWACRTQRAWGTRA